MVPSRHWRRPHVLMPLLFIAGGLLAWTCAAWCIDRWAQASCTDIMRDSLVAYALDAQGGQVPAVARWQAVDRRWESLADLAMVHGVLTPIEVRGMAVPGDRLAGQRILMAAETPQTWHIADQRWATAVARKDARGLVVGIAYGEFMAPPLLGRTGWMAGILVVIAGGVLLLLHERRLMATCREQRPRPATPQQNHGWSDDQESEASASSNRLPVMSP